MNNDMVPNFDDFMGLTLRDAKELKEIKELQEKYLEENKIKDFGTSINKNNYILKEVK